MRTIVAFTRASLGSATGLCGASTGLTGCSSTPKATSGDVALKLRAIQTRAYETTDQNKAVRTAMATLQDLGFVIDNADAELGSVTATKLASSATKMTVTVRKRGTTQLLVRANAQYNVLPVEDAQFYQQFFAAYSKAMFLEAQQIDPAAPGN